jgi:hypothetical protein
MRISFRRFVCWAPGIVVGPPTTNELSRAGCLSAPTSAPSTKRPGGVALSPTGIPASSSTRRLTRAIRDLPHLAWAVLGGSI